MFAIELTIENMPKIIDTELLSETDMFSIEMCLSHHKVWYFITGYVPPRGPIESWSVFPAYILEKLFNYDDIQIKTNWDQIVRK